MNASTQQASPTAVHSSRPLQTTRLSLPVETRQATVELLNDLLADLVNLQLHGKQAHWNVRGPNFMPLHQLFDEITGEVGGLIDELAERIVTLGGIAAGTLEAVSQRTQLEKYPLTLSRSEEHLAALATSVAWVGRRMRQSVAQIDASVDPVTADLLTEITSTLDKRLWFLEAHEPAV